MGFFGLFKGKEAVQEPVNAVTAVPGATQQAPNQGMLSPEHGLDLNSGFYLDSIRNENSDQPQYDSFGNPKRERSYESDFNPNSGASGHAGDMSKDIQIILAKLDAIKAEVSNIDHRLEMLERQGQQQQTSQRRYSW